MMVPLMEVSDVIFPAVKTLSSVEVRLVRGPKGIMFKDAEKVLAKYLPIFQAAGIKVGA